MSTASIPGDAPTHRYDEFLASLKARVAACVPKQKSKKNAPVVFTTSTSGLYDRWIAALPEHWRREYTCSTCRAFVRRFGGLVTIDDKGRTESLLWHAESAPEPFQASVRAIAEAVAAAPITGMFVSSERVWGVPERGGFQHFCVTAPEGLVHAHPLYDAARVAAERREDYRLLVASLAEFPAALVKRASGLLRTGGLYRSEKCIEVAKWLLEVHETRDSAKSERARDNLTWTIVATAPTGFCHVRSSMIGTLLEDLAADMPFDAIKARFDAKMHPLQYARPQKPPREQNIARAEKVVAQLRSSGALERRFARLDEVPAIWKPAEARKSRPKEGVFSHIQGRAKPSEANTDVDAPAVIMTWAKFSTTVLPDAASIEYCVPDTKVPLMALITAKNADAPPIIQWDSEESRNPFTWYFYHGGSLPTRWNLKPNTRQTVSAIALSPTMWAGADRNAHHGKMVIFLLEGAWDLDYKSGSAFFPEFLRSEYREIRATLEAFAKSAVVEGAKGATACGIGMHSSGMWGQQFRVTDRHGVTIVYKLDRWD